MGEVVRALGNSGATEFNHLLWVLLNSRDPMDAVERAKADRTTPSRVLEVLEKAAVQPGSLQDPSWASPLGAYQQIITEYVDSLSGFSFFDRALADRAFVPGQLGSKVAISTDTAVGSIVNEGQATPFMSFSYEAATIPITKAVAPIVVTQELARQREQMGWVGQRLRSKIVATVDTYAMSVIIAAATSTPTTGNTVAALVDDIAQAFSDVEIGQEPKLYWVLNAALAASLSARLAGSVGWDLTPAGGKLAGVPAIISAGVPSGDLVLVDASRFAADSEAITLDRSTQASVQLQSSPDSPSTGSTVQVSLWQQNKVGYKATRYFGLVALTDTAAAVITGMS